jgi:hypothetical protein
MTKSAGQPKKLSAPSPQEGEGIRGALNPVELLQANSRNSLAVFSVLTSPNYTLNWHHREIIAKLEAVERGEIKRLMLFVPPRHGKSQLATINFPAWFLGRNPNKEVITASYSGDLAVKFGAQTRELVNSPEYQKIFPGVELKQDDKSKAEWRTVQNGSYTSVGVGGSLTGRGANLMIIDDPIKNREEAESSTFRDSIWDWFTSTAYTRLEKDAAIILILTRWHLYDLAGRILKQEMTKKVKGTPWTVVKFPAIATEDELFRKEGEPLWSEKYDLNALHNIREDIGLSNWASLYQQTPILSENQEFKEDDFRYVSLTEVDAKETRNFLTIDTAISKKASSDYTGIVINYVDRENKWNIRTYKMKLDPPELINLIFHLHDENAFEKIGIEKTIFLDVFQYILNDEMRKRGIFLPIVELEHKQVSKETRIRGLLPRYNSHSIFHIGKDCAQLEEELLTFPRGIHDDVLDALAYQLQIAIPPEPKQFDYESKIQANRLHYGYKANF